MSISMAAVGIRHLWCGTDGRKASANDTDGVKMNILYLAITGITVRTAVTQSVGK